MQIWIGLICTVIGMVISYLTFNINQKKDIKKESRENAERNVRMELKLDTIHNNLNEIKADQKDIHKILNRLSERIDKMENLGDKNVS